MVATGTILLVAVAAVASFFTAWTIGAGSSGSTPFSPAVGAHAISTMRAAFVVGVLGFLGAVLQGENVTETIGNEMIRGVSLTPLAATVALTVAAGLIALGVFRGYPIATAFAVSGAVVGAGLALGGQPAWGKYGEIALLWVLTPPVGVVAAYVTARVLRSDDVPEEIAVPLLGGAVGVMVAHMDFTLLGPPGESSTPAAVLATRLPVSPLVGQTVTTLGAASR
jgi:PiT family inorganic phosphate transporter